LDFSYSETYFKGRNRESQIISTVSSQGEELSNMTELEQAYTAVDNQYKEKPLPTPESFGTWAITPYRIEFLIFNDNRFHERVLYVQTGDVWKKTLLKP
jgi:pyridoxamine 5'-phosphate oxidase